MYNAEELDEMIRAYARYERIRDAAPEMLELLRWFVGQVADIGPSHPNVANTVRLLARLDG